ncbi:MAG: T9SS type A sorting domain-containing protein [Bacteroidales bacterium]|nr:T9SS type A sorting domain-containing protein [Bacteroidales bacterium]
MPDAGSYTAEIQFVPDDPNTYASMPTTVNVTVTPKELTVSNMIVEDKVYDGNNIAIINSATLNGVVGADDVVLNDANTGTFNQTNIGIDIPVTVNMSISGTDIENYTLAQANNLFADIISKVLLVSDATAENKIYDGNNTAVIDGAILSGVVGGEDVYLSNYTSGTFAQSQIGNGISVSTNMTIDGSDIGNYSLTQPVGLFADITVRELTVGGSFTVADKIYDGNTSATMTQNNLILQNIVPNDDVSLTNVVTVFESSEIGLNIPVNISSAEITGTDVNNYSLTLSGSPSTIAAINEPAPINVQVIIVSNSACGDNNGAAQLVVSGGVEPYEYLWSNGAGDVATDTLSSGINSVIVTDALGHSEQVYFEISNTDGPAVTIDYINHVSCHGQQDGSISVIVSGNSPVLEWSTGDNTSTIEELSASTYQLTVTDNQGCVSLQTYTINEPSILTVDIETENASCDMSDGSASAIVSGGTPPYNIQWSVSDNNLSAGSYFVTAIDNKGCMLTESFNISNNGAPQIIVDSIINAECGEQAAIYISLQNVIGTPVYNWNNTYSTEDLISIPSGHYSLTVTDGLCISVLDTFITTLAPTIQELCVVTVDETTGNNLIVWEKEESSIISHYNIYRETSVSGQYMRIDSVLYEEISEYSDLLANPLVRSWRYKISKVDVCGTESELSPNHKTIHLSINAGLNGAYNLMWGDYEGFPYSTFYVNRHLNSEGWVVLDSLPTDIHSFTNIPPDNAGLWYSVTVKTPESCIPTSASKTSGGPYYQSVSNIEDEGIIDTKIKQTKNQNINIYPNPNNGNFVVDFKQSFSGKIKIFNISGQMVSEYELEMQKSWRHNKPLASGIYTIQVLSHNYSKIIKIVITE